MESGNQIDNSIELQKGFQAPTNERLSSIQPNTTNQNGRLQNQNFYPDPIMNQNELQDRDRGTDIEIMKGLNQKEREKYKTLLRSLDYRVDINWLQVVNNISYESANEQKVAEFNFLKNQSDSKRQENSIKIENSKNNSEKQNIENLSANDKSRHLQKSPKKIQLYESQFPPSHSQSDIQLSIQQQFSGSIQSKKSDQLSFSSNKNSCSIKIANFEIVDQIEQTGKQIVEKQQLSKSLRESQNQQLQNDLNFPINDNPKKIQGQEQQQVKNEQIKNDFSKKKMSSIMSKLSQSSQPLSNKQLKSVQQRLSQQKQSRIHSSQKKLNQLIKESDIWQNLNPISQDYQMLNFEFCNFQEKKENEHFCKLQNSLVDVNDSNKNNQLIVQHHKLRFQTQGDQEVQQKEQKEKMQIQEQYNAQRPDPTIEGPSLTPETLYDGKEPMYQEPQTVVTEKQHRWLQKTSKRSSSLNKSQTHSFSNRLAMSTEGDMPARRFGSNDFDTTQVPQLSVLALVRDENGSSKVERRNSASLRRSHSGKHDFDDSRSSSCDSRRSVSTCKKSYEDLSQIHMYQIDQSQQQLDGDQLAILAESQSETRTHAELEPQMEHKSQTLLQSKRSDSTQVNWIGNSFEVEHAPQGLEIEITSAEQQNRNNFNGNNENKVGIELKQIQQQLQQNPETHQQNSGHGARLNNLQNDPSFSGCMNDNISQQDTFNCQHRSHFFQSPQFSLTISSSFPRIIPFDRIEIDRQVHQTMIESMSQTLQQQLENTQFNKVLQKCISFIKHGRNWGRVHSDYELDEFRKTIEAYGKIYGSSRFVPSTSIGNRLWRDGVFLHAWVQYNLPVNMVRKQQSIGQQSIGKGNTHNFESDQVIKGRVSTLRNISFYEQMLYDSIDQDQGRRIVTNAEYFEEQRKRIKDERQRQYDQYIMSRTKLYQNQSATVEKMEIEKHKVENKQSIKSSDQKRNEKDSLIKSDNFAVEESELNSAQKQYRRRSRKFILIQSQRADNVKNQNGNDQQQSLQNNNQEDDNQTETIANNDSSFSLAQKKLFQSRSKIQGGKKGQPIKRNQMLTQSQIHKSHVHMQTLKDQSEIKSEKRLDSNRSEAKSKLQTQSKSNKKRGENNILNLKDSRKNKKLSKPLNQKQTLSQGPQKSLSYLKKKIIQESKCKNKLDKATIQVRMKSRKGVLINGHNADVDDQNRKHRHSTNDKQMLFVETHHKLYPNSEFESPKHIKDAISKQNTSSQRKPDFGKINAEKSRKMIKQNKDGRQSTQLQMRVLRDKSKSIKDRQHRLITNDTNQSLANSVISLNQQPSIKNVSFDLLKQKPGLSRSRKSLTRKQQRKISQGIRKSSLKRLGIQKGAEQQKQSMRNSEGSIWNASDDDNETQSMLEDDKFDRGDDLITQNVNAQKRDSLTSRRISGPKNRNSESRGKLLRSRREGKLNGKNKIKSKAMGKQKSKRNQSQAKDIRKHVSKQKSKSKSKSKGKESSPSSGTRLTRSQQKGL